MPKYMEPKISIITITLNSKQYLEQAIQSVIGQTYTNFEYIIVDGGSKDGTLDLLKKYASKITHCISEPDNGIADAMNKGIARASGDYILFIHSDDYLIDSEILERIVPHLSTGLDMYIFQVRCLGEKGTSVSRTWPLNWLTNFKMGSCHQGQLCSRKLFNRIGVFDTSFRIDMDYDFLLRAYRAGANSRSIPLQISVMRLVGISSLCDWPHLKQRFAEEKRVHLKNCPSRWMRFIYEVYWGLYALYLTVCRR